MTRAGDRFVIRAEQPADLSAIHDVNVLAFRRDNEAHLVAALRASEAFVPELSLVAERDGRVLGHLLFSRVMIKNATGAVPALALAPVAVRPECQNQGVGTALIRRGLERARELGHRIVLVLGHPAYYPRFGFRPASHGGIAAPFPVSDEAFMVLDLVADASAGVSGTVEYPPAFSTV